MLGLWTLPFSRTRSRVFQRALNRVIVSLLCMGTLLVIVSYTVHTVERANNIPILGDTESSTNLYFPPYGRRYYPEVPKYNQPPRIRPRTPLFIPFTRNSPMLEQAVLSYIAAGWPRADIVVIDNSGTMDANNNGLLRRNNPFRLDYQLFCNRYGVAILQTPTLLNFAQLQNFMLRQALARNWPFYFWSHMDVAVLSGEEVAPYKSFYHRVLDVLDSSGVRQYDVRAPGSLSSSSQQGNRRATRYPGSGAHEVSLEFSKRTQTSRFTKRPKDTHRNIPSWAVKFFNFDNLVLVNVEAWRIIGAWDTFIPYYHTDCDFYARMQMHGFTRDEASVGYIFDVAATVTDPEQRFFPGATQHARNMWGGGGERGEPAGGRVNSSRYHMLKEDLDAMMMEKITNQMGRNTWQNGMDGLNVQKPVEPWMYDSKGFHNAWWSTSDFGRAMYIRKWGTMQCDLIKHNKTLADVWLKEYLQPETPEYAARDQEESYWMAIFQEAPIR